MYGHLVAFWLNFPFNCVSLFGICIYVLYAVSVVVHCWVIGFLGGGWVSLKKHDVFLRRFVGSLKGQGHEIIFG